MKRSKITVTMLIVFLCFSIISTSVFATTGSYHGIGTYTMCYYGDRHGDLYVEYLSSKLSENTSSPNKVTTSYDCTNSQVYPDRLVNLFSEANLFVFAGHGLKYDKDSALNNESTLHTYASSTSDTWHGAMFYENSSEFASQYNVSWSEIPYPGECKWSIFYTCNWLANGGSATREQTIYNSLFKGWMHLALGFGTKVWLDQREGNLLGSYIRSSRTLKQAYYDAATYYQPQMPTSVGSVVARVMGAKISENDKFDSPSSTPSGYSSSNTSSYTTWDLVIPAQGITR